jgi:hypothetical protein
MWGWSEGVAGTVSHYISVHTNLGLCAQRSRDGFGERLRICASLHAASRRWASAASSFSILCLGLGPLSLAQLLFDPP